LTQKAEQILRDRLMSESNISGRLEISEFADDNENEWRELKGSPKNVDFFDLDSGVDGEYIVKDSLKFELNVQFTKNVKMLLSNSIEEVGSEKGIVLKLNGWEEEGDSLNFAIEIMGLVASFEFDLRQP
jgi:hypothetical protein